MAADEAIAASVIIPAYQEAAHVAQVVAGVAAVMQAHACRYELIVLDDGSTDGTAQAAGKAGATVVSHPYNMGYGAALKSGVRRARGASVVFMDADGQHDPRDIPRLLAERDRYDMVVGARAGMAGSPLWRRPGKAVLGWVANGLCGRRIADLNSGLRALDREMALRLLPIMPDGFSFSTTSTIAAFRAGYTVQYVPITISPRRGTSTVTAGDGVRTLLLIIRLITLFSPFRVFFPLSLIIFVVGAAFIGYSYWTVGEASLKGIVVVLASLLFFLFGILVDQVTAIRRGERML